MKKFAAVLLFSLIVAAACSDGVSPEPELAFDEAAVLAFSGSMTSDPGSRYLGHLHRLPAELALTAAQQAQIDVLLTTFNTSTKADRDALAAIHQQAHDAARAGQTRDQVRAILSQGDAARDRLRAAETALRTAIDQILTAAQKEWLANQDGRRCTPITLTDAQRTEISALVAAFQQANATDLAAIRAAHEQARAAHRSGATREQIAAILEAVRPAMERVRAAETALETAIEGVLTAEQRASGCFRFHPAPGTHGDRSGHGGPGSGSSGRRG